MIRMQVGKWEFRYIVGPYTVGIITPTRQKYTVEIPRIVDPKNRVGLESAVLGSADNRVTPTEVANYILAHQLK
jgi:hypothetical protein